MIGDPGQTIASDAADLPCDRLVLWSDESLLVITKPAGLLTLPGGYQPEPHLAALLEPAFGRLWIVHRLDRETSGVLVLARTAAAHRDLNTQFQEHTVVKVYHALVQGEPEWAERIIDLPLQPNGDRKHRTVVPTGKNIALGKPALTECHVLERYRMEDICDRYTLLEAVPRTGRTHQIRAHLAHLGLPIVADRLYGGRSVRGRSVGCGSDLPLSAHRPQDKRADEPERPLMTRTALHALSLTLRHPLTQETMIFEAPYPKDLAAALGQLRKYKKDSLLRSE